MNTILSSRVKKIIQFIISSQDGFTIQDISDNIGVSRRTILREMEDIYTWFNDQGHPIEKNANKGMLLNVKESERLNLSEKLNNELEDYYFTKEERQVFIITELLQNRESSKLFYFADMLNVSESTISHDLDKVEEWLLKYNLTLERKQGFGVKVTGRERDIRKVLVTIIYENLDGSQVKDLLSKYVNVVPAKIRKSTDIKRRLLDLIDYETIKVIENAIANSEGQMGFKFAESSYVALAVHLALAIKRIKQGEKITISPEVIESFKLYEEYHIAANLIHGIEELIGIEIPEDEIGYVTMHLKGARYKSGLVDSKLLKFNEIVIGNYQLTSIIHEMIKIAEVKTGYSLIKNESLLIGLVNHMRPAINRLQMNLEIRNPLLEKIKEQFPDIYELSVECAKIVEEKLHLKMPESEIGYIAMHIGSAIEKIKNTKSTINFSFNVVVTCISGIGTSKMLAERIKKEFRNINIVDVFASTTLTNEWLETNNIDLILSTVHFDSRKVPLVVVNPLLMKDDIIKINNQLDGIAMINRTGSKQNSGNEINAIEKMQKVNLYSSSIVEVLKNFVVKDKLECNSFDEFLEIVCTTIHKDSNKSKLLEKELLKREEIGSIVFQEEKVIVLHTRTYTSEEIQVGVFRNTTPIMYGSNTFVAALVLIAPKKIEKEKLEVIGEISSKLINDPSFLNKVKKTRRDVLIEVIEDYMIEFFDRKNKEFSVK